MNIVCSCMRISSLLYSLFVNGRNWKHLCFLLLLLTFCSSNFNGFFISLQSFYSIAQKRWETLCIRRTWVGGNGSANRPRTSRANKTFLCQMLWSIKLGFEIRNSLYRTLCIAYRSGHIRAVWPINYLATFALFTNFADKTSRLKLPGTW
jgi:hypothetical protein